MDRGFFFFSSLKSVPEESIVKFHPEINCTFPKSVRSICLNKPSISRLNRNVTRMESIWFGLRLHSKMDRQLLPGKGRTPHPFSQCLCGKLRDIWERHWSLDPCGRKAEWTAALSTKTCHRFTPYFQKKKVGTEEGKKEEGEGQRENHDNEW